MERRDFLGMAAAGTALVAGELAGASGLFTRADKTGGNGMDGLDGRRLRREARRD